MYGGGYDNNYGGGEVYDQMQNQNFGYGAPMGDPYYQQQMVMGMQPGFGYAGGFDANGYPMQPQMMYDANGFPMQQPMMYDANGFPIQQMAYPQQGEETPESANYDAQQTEVPEPSAVITGVEGERRAEPDGLKKQKSFTGPPEGTKPLVKSRSAKGTTQRKSGEKSNELARNGSLFRIKSERDTQVSVSKRGGFDKNVNEMDEEELKQYYGDMAKRHGEQVFDGFKAVKSYRGEIREGEDVGKPRRVTGARSLQGKGSTGYGGLNFKRQCAMRNGESWGDIEVRRKQNEVTGPKTRGIGFNMNDDDDDDDDEEARRRAMEEEMRRRQMEEYMRRMREAEMAAAMQQQMMMMAMMDQPAVPQVFNQEDVHSYSNLSDAFANDQIEDEEEDF